MLTTLVFAVTGITALLSLVALTMLDFDRENFWDPRHGFQLATSLVASCLQHSQLLVSQCWSRVSGRTTGSLGAQLHMTHSLSPRQRLDLQ